MSHVLLAGRLHPAGAAMLEAAEGVTYEAVDDPAPGAYLPYLARAEGLVLRTQPLIAEHIAAAPALRVVARHGVGYDAVDGVALAARGIPLAIVGDVNSRTVAEHTLALMLAASRRVVSSVVALRGGDWAQRDDLAPRELDGKTLLVVGYGRIGRRVAGLARVFGMRVLAHDPHVADMEGAEPVADLGDGLARCDVVTLHVPGNAQLIGAEDLARMKPDAVLVNTARGGLVDGAALARALREGRLGAAALDVLEAEPPAPDAALLSLDNAIVTPHAAGLTRECAERMAIAAVRNVLDHFAGRLDPALVVNDPESETMA